MKKAKVIGIITVLALVVIGAIIVICMCFGGNAEKTVEQYITAINKGNVKKALELSDYEGALAFMMLAGEQEVDYENLDDIDLNDFEDKYKEVLENKDEYEEVIEEMEEYTDELAEEELDMKIKIKSSKKCKDCKKLTKVVADVTYDGETEKITFYTMKKGTKEYVIFPHLATFFVMNKTVTKKIYSTKDPVELEVENNKEDKKSNNDEKKKDIDLNDEKDTDMNENNKTTKTEKKTFVNVGTSTFKFGVYKAEGDLPAGFDATITVKEDGTAIYAGDILDKAGKTKKVNLTGTWEAKEKSIYGLQGSPDNPEAVDGVHFTWSNGETAGYGLANGFFGNQFMSFHWISE